MISFSAASLRPSIRKMSCRSCRSVLWSEICLLNIWSTSCCVCVFLAVGLLVVKKASHFITAALDSCLCRGKLPAVSSQSLPRPIMHSEVWHWSWFSPYTHSSSCSKGGLRSHHVHTTNEPDQTTFSNTSRCDCFGSSSSSISGFSLQQRGK